MKLFWHVEIVSELMNPKLSAPISVRGTSSYQIKIQNKEHLKLSLSADCLQLACEHHDRHKTAAVLKMNDVEESELSGALESLNNVPSQQLTALINMVDDLSSEQLEKLLSDSANGRKVEIDWG